MKRRLNDRERQRLADEHWSWIYMIIEHSAYGIVIGVLFAWLLMQYDVNRIGTMIANSEHRLSFTLLLMFGFAVTFGMVTAGAAIWFRAVTSDDD